MTCSHDPESLAALADGTLQGDERHAAEQQLAACADCRQMFAQLQALDGFMRTHDADSAPSAAFDARFATALKGERPSRWAWLRRPAFLAPVVSASAAVLVAVVLFGREPQLGDDDVFIADNQEMLAELDMMRELDAVEDFEVIGQLNQLKRD